MWNVDHILVKITRLHTGWFRISYEWRLRRAVTIVAEILPADLGIMSVDFNSDPIDKVQHSYMVVQVGMEASRFRNAEKNNTLASSFARWVKTEGD